MQLFGKEGEGVYEFRPFAANPMYALKYKVNEFRVETLLQRFMKDTMLTGPMDLDLDLGIVALDKNKLLSGLNGSAKLFGHDMTIYGIDLDNLIAKYQKSQKFNLVDLGAVALAGPFGLAICNEVLQLRVSAVTDAFENWQHLEENETFIPQRMWRYNSKVRRVVR